MTDVGSRVRLSAIVALLVGVGVFLAPAVAGPIQVGYLIGPSGTTPQDGWSGGAQLNLTNCDPGEEEVTTDDAHAGAQCWRYSRGYGSPGQGTPFSPSLSVTAGDPGYATADSMSTTLWFKAVDSEGDDSGMTIYHGTLDGTDRTGMNLYIENSASGVSIGTYRWSGGTYVWEDIATVSSTEWHCVDAHCLFTNDYVSDVITYTIDAGTAGEVSSTGNSWPHPWREAEGHAYAPSNRLKFAAYADGGPEIMGFYIDDVSYAIFDSSNPGAILDSYSTGFEALAAPVADPNGPYRILVGDGVTLDGSGSSDPGGGSIVNYLWSVGALSYDAEASAISSLTWPELGSALGVTGNGVYTVRLTVTDDEGETAWAETTLTVVPEPATLCLLGGALATLLRRRRRR